MVFEDLQHIIPESVKQVPRTKAYAVLAGVIAALTVACLALSVVVGVRHGAVSPGCITPACLRVASRMRQDMNPAVDPCDNFYLYACGGWMSRHSIRPDWNYASVLYDMYLKHEERLREVVEEPTRRTSQKSAERKMKTFFKLCTHDYGRMTDAGRTLVDIIQTHLKGWYVLEPSSVAGNWSWQDGVVRLQSDYLTDVIFALRIGRSRDDQPKARIRITSGRLGMRFRNYHDGDKAATQDAYKEYMRTMAGFLLRDANVTLNTSEKNRRIEQFVSDAYGQEAKLAKIIADTRILSSWWQTKKTTVGELARNFTQFNWLLTLRTFFDQVDITTDTEAEISQTAYFVGVNAMLRNESRQTSRIMNNYMVWRLLDTYSQQLSSDYKFAKLKFTQSQYGSTEFHSTWEYCLSYTQFHFTTELALQLLRAHLGTANHTQVMNLMNAVKTTLLSRVDELAWMDDVTKKRAKQTLRATKVLVSFTNYYSDEEKVDNFYAKLNINQTEGYLTNLVRVNRFRRHLANMALKVSLKYYVWMTSVHTLAFSVHPHFIYQYNEVYVPPGTLQFPVYGLTSEPFLNFAGLGSMFGEEAVNAIDEYGSFRWVNGTYGDWWTAETTAEFDKKAGCFRDYYSTLKAGPYLIDGTKRTVDVSGEYDYSQAIRRVAGLRLAYRAYKKWANDHEQRPTPAGLGITLEQAFFVATAQTRCFLERDERAYMWARNHYIPDDIMLNGALSQMSEFRDAFKCNKQSKMAPSTQCEIF
ncbi:Endothelin-converting enzyme-like 1 [Lamellibrachia satsuma]|nr:Endothelin-converting enzyme-like 1 [Lamellibrachia satsuma]